MEYLQVLDTVRAITGRREEDRFPATPSPSMVFRRGEGSPTTFLVFDAMTAKRVLESAEYKQFRFLDRILTIVRPERTKWIRRFVDVGLIMIDGPEHERRRHEMTAALDRCIERIKQLSADDLAYMISRAAAAEEASTASVARETVREIFSESIAAIVGSDVSLPADHLFEIDFFNPFPTLSSLARCDASIEACCNGIGVDALDQSTQSAVLSLLVMGVTPLHALITALLNQCVSGLREGLSLQDSLDRTAKLDSYAIVPTNFVMRECTGSDEIDGERVVAGDIAYLFLGLANGCPFSRQSSVPFGAGAHSCSGAKLTTVMMWAVRTALALVARDEFLKMDPSFAEQGKGSAFLIYLPSTR